MIFHPAGGDRRSRSRASARRFISTRATARSKKGRGGSVNRLGDCGHWALPRRRALISKFLIRAIRGASKEIFTLFKRRPENSGGRNHRQVAVATAVLPTSPTAVATNSRDRAFEEQIQINRKKVFCVTCRPCRTSRAVTR